MPELVTTTKVNTLPKTNDFVIKFANVNGSGSASANNMFAKAIFRMGIHVSPHNIFPSNIQGLPTWYEVRVSDNNYLGRREGVDLMVAMNEQTIDSDINSIVSGCFALYDSSKPLSDKLIRDDVHYLPIPLKDICLTEFDKPSQRQLRVGEQLRHILAHSFERGDLNDPAIQDVSITIVLVFHSIYHICYYV